MKEGLMHDLYNRSIILAIGMIMLIACIGAATAAVPHACAQCSPATYPGSSTCPQACVVAFPADTEWAYPAVEVVVEEEGIFLSNTTDELPTSRFMQFGGFETPNLMDVIESRFAEA